MTRKDAHLKSGPSTVTVTFKNELCPQCKGELKEGHKIYSYEFGPDTVFVHTSCDEEFSKTVVVRRIRKA